MCLQHNTIAPRPRAARSGNHDPAGGANRLAGHFGAEVGGLECVGARFSNASDGPRGAAGQSEHVRSRRAALLGCGTMPIERRSRTKRARGPSGWGLGPAHHFRMQTRKTRAARRKLISRDRVLPPALPMVVPRRSSLSANHFPTLCNNHRSRSGRASSASRRSSYELRPTSCSRKRSAWTPPERVLPSGASPARKRRAASARLPYHLISIPRLCPTLTRTTSASSWRRTDFAPIAASRSNARPKPSAQ